MKLQYFLSHHFQLGEGRSNGRLALLLVTFLAINCLSFAAIDISVGAPRSNVLPAALTSCLAISFVPLFLIARFSFGFLLGVSFTGIIWGFVWITYSSKLNYDHSQARLSAIASLFLFLLPVLFQIAPLPRSFVLSYRSMDRMLTAILWLAAAVVIWGGYYGFAFVGINEAETLRGTLVRPSVLNYVIGSLIGAALPFTFAYFALQRRYNKAALSIMMIALFYPIVLTKTVIFATVWLPFVFVMFNIFEARRATVIVLLIPLMVGLLIFAIAPPYLQEPISVVSRYVFGYANIRMFAVPSIALDHYSEFFGSHPRTGFCQINVVRFFLVDCPYTRQLGEILSDRYGLGNLNASLFSTEGIASVGQLWAPASAFVCGVIVSIGNSASVRHPASLVATSAGLAVQALLNVPLSTSILSNGLLVLFLLWHVAPNVRVEGGGAEAESRNQICA